MNIKLVALAIAVCVIAGGAFYFFSSKNGDTSDVNKQTGEKVTEGAFAPAMDNNLNGTGSFKNLIGMGKSVQCSISYKPATAEGAYDGSIYVSGGKMRGTFSMTMNGSAMETNMIMDGTTGYTWSKSPMGETAVKFAIDSNTEKTSGDKQFDVNQDVSYRCQNWAPDASVFVPPTDLKFMDMSAMMNTNAQAGGGAKVDVKAMQCGACAQISDKSGQAQCLEQFACN